MNVYPVGGSNKIAILPAKIKCEGGDYVTSGGRVSLMSVPLPLLPRLLLVVLEMELRASLATQVLYHLSHTPSSFVFNFFFFFQKGSPS
jgi:hypothetical protein